MLLALVLLPILAGSAMLLSRGEDRRVYRGIGVVVALATLAIAIAARSDDWSVPWLRAPFVANFHLGIGTLAFWLIALLALCTACAVLAVDSARPRALVGQLLLLEGTMLGLFISRDLLLFAFFYDLMLVPVFFVLLERGEHPRDAWRYIIYNFAGGLLLLFATAAFGVLHGTTDVIGTAGNAISGTWAPWIFWGFAIAFLVKTPAFPLHTWMPNTYASLPAPVAAVVGAVQSKAGLYGFFVIALALMPQEVARYSGTLIVLGSISLLYGAVAALVQTDAKRVVAYSSLSRAPRSISSRTGSLPPRSSSALDTLRNAKRRVRSLGCAVSERRIRASPVPLRSPGWRCSAFPASPVSSANWSSSRESCRAEILRSRSSPSSPSCWHPPTFCACSKGSSTARSFTISPFAAILPGAKASRSRRCSSHCSISA